MEGVPANQSVLGVLGERVFDVEGAFRMIVFTVLAMAAAEPLPAPPQKLQGYGSIPGEFGGMLLFYPHEGVDASEWSCSAQSVDGKEIKISGSTTAIEPDASQKISPRGNPHPFVTINSHSSHGFAARYISTFSNSEAAHYGMVSGVDGMAYYIGIDTFGFSKPSKIEISKISDGELEAFAEGNCTGKFIASPKK